MPLGVLSRLSVFGGGLIFGLAKNPQNYFQLHKFTFPFKYHSSSTNKDASLIIIKSKHHINMGPVKKRLDPKQYFLLKVLFCGVSYNLINFKFVATSVGGGGGNFLEFTKIISLCILGRFLQICYQNLSKFVYKQRR